MADRWKRESLFLHKARTVAKAWPLTGLSHSLIVLPGFCFSYCQLRSRSIMFICSLGASQWIEYPGHSNTDLDHFLYVCDREVLELKSPLFAGCYWTCCLHVFQTNAQYGNMLWVLAFKPKHRFIHLLQLIRWLHRPFRFSHVHVTAQILGLCFPV